jgi:hypothetical protein
MKLCKDCTHFIDLRRGFCANTKLPADPVRGEIKNCSIPCEFERYVGSCGLDARNFKEKGERDV